MYKLISCIGDDIMGDRMSALNKHVKSLQKSKYKLEAKVKMLEDAVAFWKSESVKHLKAFQRVEKELENGIVHNRNGV